MKRVAMLTIALIAGGLAAAPQKGLAQMTNTDRETLMRTPADTDHPYAGMWITEDGHIRHALLPEGRYDEARGSRESAYRGRYEVRGNYISYWDDTGFTADGEFIDDVLHHARMILYRDGSGPH